MFSQRKTPDPSDVCLGSRYHNVNVFGGTLFTHNNVTPTFPTAMHCKNKSVVLTAELLP